MDDLLRTDGRAEDAEDGAAEIFDLCGVDGDVGRVAFERDVGRADEREVLLIGQDKDDAAIVVLEDVAVRAVVEAADNQVAAFDQAGVGGIRARMTRQDLGDPGSGGVDDGSGFDGGVVVEGGDPGAVFGFEGGAAGAGADRGAMFVGVEGVEDDEAGVVDPGVGVFEGSADAGLEGCAFEASPEVDAAGAGEGSAAADVVVDEEADADEPGGAAARALGEDEAHGPGDVGGDAQEDGALFEGFADEAELAVFEVSEAAVDELAGGGGGTAGKVVLFDEDGVEASAGGVAGDAGTVDAATDDEEIGRCGRFVHKGDATQGVAGGAIRGVASSDGRICIRDG